MSVEKLYTVAGTTTINGQTKVRFANDLIARIKIFNSKGGQVNLVELPQAMTKLQALQHLATLPEFNSGDNGFAIQLKIAEKTKIAKKGEIKVAATAVKAKAPKAKASKAESV